MNTQIITIQEYCALNPIEPSFIYELEEVGLIYLLEQENEKYIPVEILDSLESYSRMFYELEINLAGIDVIHNLLNKIKEMEQEIIRLKNKLNLYE